MVTLLARCLHVACGSSHRKEPGHILGDDPVKISQVAVLVPENNCSNVTSKNVLGAIRCQKSTRSTRLEDLEVRSVSYSVLHPI